MFWSSIKIENLLIICISTTIDCNFSKSNILNFLEIQFVQICFVFRMHVLETFLRDSKLFISKHKTDNRLIKVMEASTRETNQTPTLCRWFTTLILVNMYNEWTIFFHRGSHRGRSIVSLNPVHGEVYSMQHYVIKLSVTCDR